MESRELSQREGYDVWIVYSDGNTIEMIQESDMKLLYMQEKQ